MDILRNYIPMRSNEPEISTSASGRSAASSRNNNNQPQNRNERRLPTEEPAGGQGNNKPGWAEYDKAAQVDHAGCVGGEDPDECPFIHRLKWDLANSYYWTGNFIRDYFFFVMQWHPLLGILMCHPNHPWSKLDRFYMFCISLGLTFVPSCIISSKVAGDSDEPLVTTTLLDPLLSTTPSVLYPSGQDVEHGVRKGSALVLTILFVTIPDAVIGVILYQLAIAETRCAGWTCCVGIGKCFMKFVLVFAVIICSVNAGIGYLVLKDGGPLKHALQVLIMGKLYSYGTWFIIWLFLPCGLGYLSLWHSENKAAERKAAEQQGGRSNRRGLE